MTLPESLLIPLVALLAVTGFDRLPAAVRESAWMRFTGGALLGAAAVWMIVGEMSIASWRDGVLYAVLVAGASVGVRTLFDLTRQTDAGTAAPRPRRPTLTGK